MEVVKVEKDSSLWNQLIDYAKNCSWEAPGRHLAYLLRENKFVDWESIFAAIDGDKIIGFCTFLKTDYYPENRYSPWISCIFVDENYRGHRVSHAMIEKAIQYAKSLKFTTVYIPSDMMGYYEKCGFTKIDELQNYAGDIDNIFSKDI